MGDTKITYRGEWGFSQEAGRYDINNFTNRPVIFDGVNVLDPANYDPTDPNPQFGNRTLGVATTEIPNLQDYQEKWLSQNGFFQTNYIAVQGRAAQTNFLASFQRLDDEGVIQFNDGYSRNAFRLNVYHRISDKFDVQVSHVFHFTPGFAE